MARLTFRQTEWERGVNSDLHPWPPNSRRDAAKGKESTYIITIVLICRKELLADPTNARRAQVGDAARALGSRSDRLTCGC